jgi:hypothetical protein
LIVRWSNGVEVRREAALVQVAFAGFGWQLRLGQRGRV